MLYNNIMQIFEKLKEYYISLYKRILMNLPRNTFFKSDVYKNSTTTRTMNSSATLTFSTKTEEKKKTLEEFMDNLLKDYMDSPEKLLKYMKKEGMKVYKMKQADKILDRIGEQEGFLTPLKGLKALILNFILGIMVEKKLIISFNTSEMFIFNDTETEIYTLSRALYKYYGYKNNLPGYDYKSQEIYKKIYKKDPNQKGLFNKFSLKDMYACKDAMARNLEAINYTVNLAERYEGSKKALQKIKDDNSANI